MTDADGVLMGRADLELYLGLAAAHLGELDTAVDELTVAVERCATAGAVAHLAEARAELASARLRRGDRIHALAVAVEAKRAADALGMAPLSARLAPVVRAHDGLTAREFEVAACVARGLTNRQIAAELVVSERTVENHIQHILTKLGFTNRSQIAAWAAARK